MSKHLHIAARKRRYRRISNGDAADALSATVPIVFDRLESLQQKILAKQLHEPLDIVLLTCDRYLSMGLNQSLFKHLHTQVCATVDEVDNLLKQSPLPRVLIDLDCVNDSIIRILDATRRWQKSWPFINITLLTASRCVQTVNLIKAAASFQVVDRRQEVNKLCDFLVRKPHHSEQIYPAQSLPSAPFSNREWNILLNVAKGDSLKTIAASLRKPYHQVVYTIGKVNARIGLDNNKSLKHLLNKFSLGSFEKD
ncbi:hypothetical protein AB1E22_16675 [Buttiauxella gaviniae]|uniref:Uncharacterized protein n=1 Tax=Buttiauxella gaviniae TaxID=82990 RepID=A0ABV3NXS8_9ENTR